MGTIDMSYIEQLYVDFEFNQNNTQTMIAEKLKVNRIIN